MARWPAPARLEEVGDPWRGQTGDRLQARAGLRLALSPRSARLLFQAAAHLKQVSL